MKKTTYGFALFLGTMFALSEDRNKKGEGFTHKIGDEVKISSEDLGSQLNWVNTCDQIPKWDFGIGSFINLLRKRNTI